MNGREEAWQVSHCGTSAVHRDIVSGEPSARLRSCSDDYKL